MASSEQSGIALVLSCHSVPHHPLKELFKSVHPIGRGRIGVVAPARFIPYQNRFCEVVTPDAAEFRRVLQSWDEPGKSLQTRDGTINQEDGDLLRHPVNHMQHVTIAGLSLGSLPEGRWRRLSSGEWKRLLDRGELPAH